MTRDAYDEGFRAGWLEGHRAGWLEGHRAGWSDGVAARQAAAAPAGPHPATADEPLRAREPRAPHPAVVLVPPGKAPPAQAPPAQGSPLQVRVPPSPEQRAAQAEADRRRRERRGIQSANIALYAASLLIVAAGSLFLYSATSEGARLAGLAVITALFYVAGLVVHARYARLRPAAVALTGTGLALLPVTGLAFDLLAVHDPSATVAVTSLIGIVAYGLAALRIESRVLVFLTLAFFISGAWSGASALGGPLASALGAVLGVSALFGAVSLVRPAWVPPLVLRPIAVVHPFVVPATFVAATVSAGRLAPGQYALLVGIMAVYLGVETFLPGGVRARRAAWWGARALGFVAAVGAVGDAVDTGVLRYPSAIDAALAAGIVALGAETAAVCLLGRRLAAALGPAKGTDRVHRFGVAEQSVAAGFQILVMLVAVSVAIATPETAPLGRIEVGSVLATAVLIASWYGMRSEFLPVAAFLGVWIIGSEVGETWFASAAAAYAVYFGVRAAWPAPLVRGAGRPAGRGGYWRRGHFLTASGLVSIVAVAALVDAGLASSDAAVRAASVALSVVLTAVAELLVVAVLGFLDRPARWRPSLVAVLGMVAVAALAVVAAAEQDAGSWRYSLAVSAVCAGSLGLSAGLVLVPSGAARRAVWAGPITIGELAPPLLLTAATLAALLQERWWGAAVVLTVLAVLLGACAWRTARAGRLWPYVWLARAFGTIAATVAFHALLEDGARPAVAGEALTEWHIVAAAALLQMAVPLAVDAVRRARGGSFEWALQDSSTTLTVALFAGVALHAAGVAGGRVTSPVTAGFVVALGGAAAAAGLVLHARRAAAGFGAVGLVATWLLAGEDLRLTEVLLGLFTVYSALMVLLAPSRRLKGAHLVAARALPLVLAAVITWDAAASVAITHLVLALGLAGQHAVRALLGRHADIPFQRAAYWSGLAAQLALPFAYGAGNWREPEGGRWVLLLELLLVVVSAAATARTHRGAAQVGVVAAALALVAASPFLAFAEGTALADPLVTTTGLILIASALAAVHVVGMARWGESGPEGWPRPWTTGAAVFAALALAVASDYVPRSELHEYWLLGLAYGVCAAVLVAVSNVWARLGAVAAVSFPLGVLLTLGAGSWTARSAFDGVTAPWQQPLVALVGTLVPAGLWLAARWAGVWARDAGTRLERSARLGEPLRRWTILAAAVGALGVAGGTSWSAPASIVLPALAAALVAVVAAELAPRHRRLAVELGAVLATAAVQRAILSADMHSPLWLEQWREALVDRGAARAFWLGQWYVVVTAAVALLRYVARSRDEEPRAMAPRIWLGAAAAQLSFWGLGTALYGDTGEQVWLLVGFAALTGLGVVFGERPFAVWGALGVLACILWAVRSYAYALLGVLGLALIGAAIWWLARRPRAPRPGE
ncbi:hypothetical protein [Sinomonas sp. R1AF57]|uniref:hypothetical protein n=1 Tax=Sinomonas sp. R1AF57 TaxID=2020377 RepID=UPI000B5FAC10|nr:hypothetical protein [Sinomonas sp. R1AF57]ASN52698.1 hypothetical protein CGQ25_11880 [Sinomonas sp. R1AF57]